MFKKLQDWLIDYLTRDLLKAIRKKDVFYVEEKMSSSGKIFKQLIFRGKESTPEFQNKMKEEAMSIKDSAIWKAISTRVKWEVYEKMFKNCKNVDDIRAGKMSLYTLQLIEETFDELSEL